MNNKREIKQNRELTGFIHQVARLNAGLVAAGDRLMRDYGLSSARWRVMGALRGEGRPVTVAGIARLIGLKRQGVQRIANELEREGYVRLVENPDHKRARLVEITPAGEAAFGAVMAQYDIWAAKIEKKLPEGSLGEMMEFIARMRDLLEQAERPVQQTADCMEEDNIPEPAVELSAQIMRKPVRLPGIAPWP